MVRGETPFSHVVVKSPSWVNVAVIYAKLLLTESLVFSSGLKNYNGTRMK